MPRGRCRSCGGAIARPEGLGYDEQLAWALRHPDGDRAVLAARTLGRRRSQQAVPKLKDVVLNPPDPYVAAEALRSLTLIEEPERLRALLERVAASDSLLPARVARAALSEQR